MHQQKGHAHFLNPHDVYTPALPENMITYKTVVPGRGSYQYSIGGWIYRPRREKQQRFFNKLSNTTVIFTGELNRIVKQGQFQRTLTYY